MSGGRAGRPVGSRQSLATCEAIRRAKLGQRPDGLAKDRMAAARRALWQDPAYRARAVAAMRAGCGAARERRGAE